MKRKPALCFLLSFVVSLSDQISTQHWSLLLLGLSLHNTDIFFLFSTVAFRKAVPFSSFATRAAKGEVLLSLLPTFSSGELPLKEIFLEQLTADFLHHLIEVHSG